jgi:hypothetical protein
MRAAFAIKDDRLGSCHLVMEQLGSYVPVVKYLPVSKKPIGFYLFEVDSRQIKNLGVKVEMAKEELSELSYEVNTHYTSFIAQIYDQFDSAEIGTLIPVDDHVISGKYVSSETTQCLILKDLF